MGHQSAVAVCARCNEKVLASCLRPFHLLHLLMTVVTGGFWAPVWGILAIRSMTCRCRKCGGPVSRWKADCRVTTASLARPFAGEIPAESAPGSAFNAMLVRNNLVYYMPTSAPLR